MILITLWCVAMGGYSEVGNFNDTLARDQDIRSLDIAMNNILVVQID